MTVQDFLDGQPVLAKVIWADAEVALLIGQPTTYGLLAEIPNASTGGVTRYFVPWTAISYLKQEISAPAASPTPTPLQTTGHPTDSAVATEPVSK